MKRTKNEKRKRKRKTKKKAKKKKKNEKANENVLETSAFMDAMRKRVAKSSPDFSVSGISIAFTVDPPSFGGSSFSPPASFLSLESSAAFFGSTVLADSFKGSCFTSSDFGLCLVWWCGLSSSFLWRWWWCAGAFLGDSSGSLTDTLPFLTGASSVSANLAFKLASEIQNRMED